MVDSWRENSWFTLKWEICIEETLFSLKFGILEEKMRELWLKWGILEEKTRDFQLNGGFAKRKRDFCLNGGFSKRKRVIFA